ncbi:hypothetical protein ACH5RR_000605 [Cinchona calisaya]|uniref:Neprosin PEP catalytic domain-containing protein n=1 Tax=Cinchona calisaya TaxID=153742 RepID=A0ABD3B152_9GENT
MRPSYYPDELFGDGNKQSNFVSLTKDDITEPIIQLWHLNGRCPMGTVPIRRTKQEDIMKAKSVNSIVKQKRKSFSQLPLATTLLNSATHEDPKEFSLSQIWILGGPDSNFNTIEAGWIVYPYLFADNNTRLFTYWTSDAYQSTGCYNLYCSGVIQTNNVVALGGSIKPFSTYHGSQVEITILIWKDPNQEVWWLMYGTEIIGYWPTSLFQYLTDSASLIEWGGEVLNNKPNGQHTTTKMGSGHFAEEGYQGASYFRNLQVVDDSNNLRPPGVSSVTSEQPKCYNILLQNSNNWGDYFFYGGPGRNPNCP